MQALNNIEGPNLLGFPIGYKYGLTLFNSFSDSVNDILIDAGGARDLTNAFNLYRNAAHTKQIDATFSDSALASGGRDSNDNLTGPKWFNVLLIGGSGKTSQGFFTTSSSPTLPTGFTYYRRLGSIYWTGSTIKAFHQYGDIFIWDTLNLDSTATIGTTASQITLLVPIGVVVEAKIRCSTSAAGAYAILVTSTNETNSTPSSTYNDSIGADVNSITTNYPGRFPLQVITDTSAQIRLRALANSSQCAVHTKGWREFF